MGQCPHCGAETRPEDRFCLTCGNRLPSPTPSYQQAVPTAGDATLPAQDEWIPPVAQSGQTMPASASPGDWGDNNMATIADSGSEDPTARVDEQASTIAASPASIEHPAQFVLRADNGDVLQEYSLDRPEIAIGRAPNSDILLSKDKLTSRRHATVHYENGSYVLRDERSANGTYVNGQQLEEMTPRVLQDGDHIGIGEHELIFRAPVSVEDLPTVSVNPSELTFKTREDDQLTATSNDEFSTRSMNGDSGSSIAVQPAAVPQPVNVPAASAPVTAPVEEAAAPSTSTEEANAPIALPGAATASPADSYVSQPLQNNAADGVTFSRLTGLSQPALPDMAPLLAALSTLDGQVSSLQEQLNSTQEAMRNHDNEIAQTTSQLRAGVRRVSDRMDNTIADVARSREAMAWAELQQLMDDVTNNPRDIEYVTKLARKARELNKVFQIHQNVLSTLAECNSLLRSLIGEDH